MKRAFLALLAFAHVAVLGGCSGEASPGQRAGDLASGGSVVNASGGASSGSGGTPAAQGGAITGGGTAGTGTVTAGSTSTGGSGQGGSGTQNCGEVWVAGTTYSPGDIVLYEADGNHYIAENENPGYEPNVSTWFWEPYVCNDTGGNGGTGGGGSTGTSGFSEIVSESLFNQMFPDRDAFYTYQGLVEATMAYPEFASSGTIETRKREAAAFLANVARETGHLVYIDQIAKDDYCASSESCPCQGGKQYYGRGPIQISWNYNYCSAGAALGYDLRAQPELVSQNATIAWGTGLWFWNTQTGAGSYTPHAAMADGHGFGETIRSINGTVECGGGPSEGVLARVDFYTQFCGVLGVTTGDNLTC
jgi:predicted chitinase